MNKGVNMFMLKLRKFKIIKIGVVMTRKMRAFLAGISSILVIQPAICSPRITVPNNGKRTADILRDDFKKIGDDFKSSIIKVSKKINDEE